MSMSGGGADPFSMRNWTSVAAGSVRRQGTRASSPSFLIMERSNGVLKRVSESEGYTENSPFSMKTLLPSPLLKSTINSILTSYEYVNR